MALMCSLQSCVAKPGMCGHEKVMFGIVGLVVAGLGVYWLAG